VTYTVYILYSDSTTKIYIGYTSNLIQRIHSHNTYGRGWTKRFRPWLVIYCEYYEEKWKALQREKELKKAKGRQWIWGKINTQFHGTGFISA
jgi:putative endonuclease